MITPARTTPLVLGVVLAAALAGCGGGEDGDSSAELTAAVEATTTGAATSAATTAATAPKKNKRRPKINGKALAFLAIDSCAKPKKGWWRCRSGAAVVLIRAKVAPDAVLEGLRARKDWVAGDSVVLAVKGGGVVYVPTLAGMPQLSGAGPFPNLEQVDTVALD